MRQKHKKENSIISMRSKMEQYRWGDENNLLDEAIKETENLSVGEIFLVRDLFMGYLWKRIPHGDRLLYGTLFLNYVKKTKGNIQKLGKILQINRDI